MGIPPGGCAIAGTKGNPALVSQLWRMIVIASTAASLTFPDLGEVLENLPADVREIIVVQFSRIADAGNELRPDN